MGAPMGGVPFGPPMSERETAIASAVSAAAAAAQAKAAAEWDDAERDARMTGRKAADEAAVAVDAQAKLCEEADAALRQAVAKLAELEQAKQQAHAGLPTLYSGTAIRWNQQKGFGFITQRGGGPDLFCHANDILDGTQLTDGAPVRFAQGFDERKQKYYAAEVTGGAPAPAAGEPEADEAADGQAGFGDNRPKRQRHMVNSAGISD